MKKTQMMRTIGCVVSLILLIVGCDPNMKLTEDEQKRDLASSEEYYDQTHKVIEQQSLVEFSNDYYVTNKSHQIEQKVELPAVFDKKVIYSSAVSENLTDILSDMYAQTNIKFLFTPDALKYISPNQGGATVTTAQSSSTETAEVAIGSSDFASNEGILKDVQMNLQYEGLFSEFVERVASKFNLYWEYDAKDKAVRFFRTKTKVFALDLLPGSTSMSNNMTSSSTIGGDGSGAELNSGAVMTVLYENKEGHAWNDTAATIKAMLTAEGVVSENRRTGYIAVTDIPSRLERIESYINKINDKARRKIAVKVDIFDVKVDRKTDYGINWDAVIAAMGGQVTLDSGTSVSPLGNSITDVVKFNYPTPGEVASGFFDSALALFQALSKVGDTSKVTGTTIYTVNGEPAPVQVVQRTDYVKDITFSAVSDQSSTTQVAITPGTVVSGFFMVVTPSILSNNQILLNLSFSLSTADVTTNTQTVCPAGQTTDCPSIALPIVDSKNFMETVTLNGGQSVILSGFQELNNSIGVSSVAEPSLWALGGNKAANHKKTITVTLVTPYLIGR